MNSDRDDALKSAEAHGRYFDESPFEEHRARDRHTLSPNTILLLLALCAGMLAPGLAGGQGETQLNLCFDGRREWAARAKAYRTAAEQGDTEAQFRLGQMYATGTGVPKASMTTRAF